MPLSAPEPGPVVVTGVSSESLEPLLSREAFCIVRLWGALTRAFMTEQVFEVIALVGFYHTVSYFANGFRLAPESYAAPFPTGA